MVDTYYRGGNGILVVYDITNRESFEKLNSWIIDINNKGSKYMHKILIGNKCDLEEERRVTFEEGKNYADINGMDFYETSAKSAKYVQEVFEKLAIEILSNYEKNKNNIRRKSFKIKGESICIEYEPKKKTCC
jgi:Ras-related protein Rab-1A